MSRRSCLALLSYFLAFPFLGGCSAKLGNEYFIVIDPSFSAAQQEEIIQAAQVWEAALDGGVVFTSITIGQCHAANKPTDNTNDINPGTERMICFHTTTEAWLLAQYRPNPESHFLADTWRHDDLDSADVYIPVDYDTSLSAAGMQETVAHELGHAMGLNHVAGNNLMYWAMGEQASAPTCNDVAQWMNLRHLSDVTLSCPKGGSYTYYH